MKLYVRPTVAPYRISQTARHTRVVRSVSRPCMRCLFHTSFRCDKGRIHINIHLGGKRNEGKNEF